ncbi:hypothetical protein ACFL4Y_02435 [Gemmatimonadota bacterium]
MAKGKSFADKVAKAREQQGDHCPVCGETIKSIMVVAPIESERSGALRFRRKLVGVCSCNQKDVYA